VSHSTLPPLAATQDPESPPEIPRRNLHLNQRVQEPTAKQPQPISMGADYFVLCDAPKAPKSRLGACQGSARLSSAEVRTTLLTPPRAAISQAHTSAPVRGALDWQAREVNVAPQAAWYARGGIEKPLKVQLIHLAPGSAAPQHGRHAVSGFQPVGLSAASSATWARPQTPPPPVARPSTAPSVSPFAYAYNDGVQPKNMGPAFYMCERSGDMPHVVHYSSRHPRTALAAFSVR
jgi:hypothetical protein